MAGAQFVVYKKDNFGRDNHISQINSFSAKLRHARNRHRKIKTAAKDKDNDKRPVDEQEIHEEAVKELILRDASQPPIKLEIPTGMSDPFSSTKIPIDPNVYRIISFDLQSIIKTPPPVLDRGTDRTRDGIFMYALRANTRHHLVVHLLGGRVMAAGEKEESMRALDNVATAYAFLSCRASVMAEMSKDPSMNYAALYFKQHAIQQLRENLGTDKLSDNFLEKIKTIHSLFTAEIACHNFEAAMAHSLALKYLLESDLSAIIAGANLSILQGVLWQEVQRAILSMTSVTFNLNRWAEVLGLQASYDYWDSSYVGDIFLHEHLRLVMAKIMMLAHTSASAFFSEPQTTLLRISAQGLLLQSQLINRIVKNKKLLTEVSDEMKIFKEQVRMESCLCLAVLYWLRRAMFNEPYVTNASSKYRMYSAATVIMDDLLALLSDVRVDGNPNSPKARSLFFVYYVGAIMEHTWMKDDDYPDMESLPFHNKQFVLQAFSMGIATWPETKAVLQDFLYHDGIGTAAEFWFGKIQELFMQEQAFFQDSESSVPSHYQWTPESEF